MPDLNDKLDALLQRRAVEAPSDDLAERIIMAARQRTQVTPVSLVAWIKDLFHEFSLPQPVYAFASVLALGLVLGASLPAGSVVSTTMQDTLFDLDSGSY
jgi:hypothetical protein